MFVILSVLFVSSSVNSLISVAGSLDRYFEKAGVGDFIAAELYGGKVPVSEAVKKADGTKTLKTEENMICAYEFIPRDDSKKAERYKDALASCLSQQIYKYFDGNNKEITKIPDGELYVRQTVLDQSNAKIGDRVTLVINGVEKTFTVKDNLKDAVLSIELANPRFLISENDYWEIRGAVEKTGAEKGTYLSYLHMIDTDDVPALELALSGCDRIYFSDSRDSFRLFHITEIVVVGIWLAVSIGLILIAIAILGFTIGSTISREFRQIGIMKAIGISNGKIRTIYLVKYLAITLIGAPIGLLLSFPLGKLMQENMAKSILIENNNALLIGVLCMVGVTGLIVLLSILFTRRVIAYSPMDALRSGMTGARYQKKGMIQLGRTPVRPALFMSINDLLSNPKQVIIMTFVFFIGMTLLLIVLNISSTIQSPEMVRWEGEAEFHLQLVETDSDPVKYAGTDGRKRVCETIAEAEKMLREEGFSAKCFMETRVFASVYTEDSPERVFQQYCREGVNCSTEEYAYIEGRAPKNKEEIAISYKAANQLQVSVGDKVTVVTADGKENCIVSAIYQEIMLKQWGSIRRYPDASYSYEGLIDVLPITIRFEDNPSAAEVERRMEVLRSNHPEYKVRSVSDQISAWFGDIPGTVNRIANMLLPIIVMIDVLVAVMMELSFLTKERGEIAMLKAIGFKNRTLIFWQVLRIGLVMFVAALLAIFLAGTIGRLTLGGVYRYLGIRDLIFDPNIWKNYICYPAAVLTATVISSFLVASGVRKIHSNEINSIE